MQRQEEVLEQVASEIGALLDANGGSDTVLKELFAAFMAHVFSAEIGPDGTPKPTSGAGQQIYLMCVCEMLLEKQNQFQWRR